MSLTSGGDPWNVQRKQDWVVQAKQQEPADHSENIVQFVQGREVKDLEYAPATENWDTYVDEKGQACLCRPIKWTVFLEGKELERSFLFKSGVSDLSQANFNCEVHCAVTKEMILGDRANRSDATHRQAMSILQAGGVVALKDKDVVFKGRGDTLALNLNPNLMDTINAQRDTWLAPTDKVNPFSLAPSSDRTISLREFADLFHPDVPFTAIAWKPADEWVVYTNREGKECLGQSVAWTFTTADSAINRNLLIETGIPIDLSNPHDILRAKREAGLIYRVQCTALKEIMLGAHGSNHQKALVQQEALKCLHHLREGGSLKLEKKHLTPHLTITSGIESARVYLYSLKADSAASTSFGAQVEAEKRNWESLDQQRAIISKGNRRIEPQTRAQIYAPPLAGSTEKKTPVSIGQFKVDVENLIRGGVNPLILLIPPSEHSSNRFFHQRDGMIYRDFQKLAGEVTAEADKPKILADIQTHQQRIITNFESLQQTEREMRDLFEQTKDLPSLRRDESMKKLALHLDMNKRLLDEWRIRYDEAKQLEGVTDVDEAIAIHQTRIELEQLVKMPATTTRHEKMLQSLAKIKPGDTNKLTQWQREYGADLKSLYDKRFQEMKDKIGDENWNPKDHPLHKVIEGNIVQQKYFIRLFESQYLDLWDETNAAQGEVVQDKFTRFMEVLAVIVPDPLKQPKRVPSENKIRITQEDQQRVDLQEVAYTLVVTKRHESMLDSLSKIKSGDTKKIARWEQEYSKEVESLYDQRFQKAKDAIGEGDWKPENDFLHEALRQNIAKQENARNTLEAAYQRAWDLPGPQRVDVHILIHAPATTQRHKNMVSRLSKIKAGDSDQLALWLREYSKNVEHLLHDNRFKNMQKDLEADWDDQNPLHESIAAKIQEQADVIANIRAHYTNLQTESASNALNPEELRFSGLLERLRELLHLPVPPPRSDTPSSADISSSIDSSFEDTVI